ncbi:MAG: type II toxin-antitoxin system RelE/ParE family toxin [Candidatus Magasanikbacteria bacterium]
MIKSFKDKETKKIFNGEYSKELPEDIQSRAYRKLVMLNAAVDLRDLKSPPGNRLEKLKNNDDLYSIRINDQFRIRFIWKDNIAYQVEIVDYH